MTLSTWLGFHAHDLITERDEQGQLIYRCQKCPYVHTLFKSPIVTDGSAHRPAPVYGEPTGKAQRITKGNRITFPRESQR